MLEKVNELAEQAATGVSRRAFLDRFGRGAFAAAAVLSGFLALPKEAPAGRRCPKGERWCRYYGHCIPNGVHCTRSGER